MSYFRELLIVESFELHNNYKKLSKSEATKYWLRILQPDKSNEDTIIDSLYKELHWLKNYYIKNEGREYLIYSFYDKGTYEIHFYDLDNIEDDNEFNNLGATKNSMYVFSTVISIVMDELLGNSVKRIKIGAPKNKENLYLKIIQKVLVKYNLDKNIKTVSSSVGKDFVIESDFIKMTPQNIMELKLNVNPNINRLEVLNTLKGNNSGNL